MYALKGEGLGPWVKFLLSRILPSVTLFAFLGGLFKEVGVVYAKQDDGYQYKCDHRSISI